MFKVGLLLKCCFISAFIASILHHSLNISKFIRNKTKTTITCGAVEFAANVEAAQRGRVHLWTRSQSAASASRQWRRTGLYRLWWRRSSAVRLST